MEAELYRNDAKVRFHVVRKPGENYASKTLNCPELSRCTADSFRFILCRFWTTITWRNWSCLKKKRWRRWASSNKMGFSHRVWAQKDESFRFCTEHCRMNAVTVRDSYSIPRMDECLVPLGKAKLFTTLYAKSGTRKIKMGKKSVEKTTFLTHDGLYKYTRILFGLKNALATFQKAMNVVRVSVKRQYDLASVSVDIIFGTTKKEHWHIEERLKLVNNDELTIKLKKCSS